jgi:pimeloyl-ACP methyl ester carboxylesterase
MLQFPFDEAAFWHGLLRFGITRFAESLPAGPDVTFTVATHARHYIPGDDPDLVIEAIRRVTAQAVRRRAAGDASTAETAVVRRAPTVVHVVPPTGTQATDRASIVAALEQARAGDTIQFAPGMYRVGALIPVSTPRLTILGHDDGTVLRGCDPAEFDAMEREHVRIIQTPDPDNPRAAWNVVSRCGMLELTGGHVTIRHLTFEYGRLGVVLGCCASERAFRPSAGGYLIEGNTFRNSGNSIRALLSSADPTVIRNNTFVNVFHALSAAGSHIHFLDNHISVPEPRDVPGVVVGFGISISSILPGAEQALPAGACDHNVIAGNHVAGHLNGIFIVADPGTTCTGNIIRDNTIAVRRAGYHADWAFAGLVPLDDPSDSTFVGVPLTLWGIAGEGAAAGTITGSLVEGNRVIGAEGIGIELVHATGSRVVNNTLSGIVRRQPFPGNLDGPAPQWSDEHNGSGIWVSAGSNDNEITGNVFENVAAYAVVLAGDRNRVAVRSGGDAAHDMGNGNQVATPPAAHEEVEALTARFVRALNDDSWRSLAPFYAPDAVLTLADGTVLEGRDAILAWFRPFMARIRGVEATASTIAGDDGPLTVSTTYTARFAPATDPVPATFSNTWALQPDGSRAIVAGTFALPGDPELQEHGPIRGGYFHSDGVRLHYLDFGGEGVPLLLISSGDRTAYAFMEFAPRFVDQNRVLALSQRGAGPSEGEPAPLVAAAVLGRDIVTLLDSLGIERAVVAHMWEHVLVYLAEEHPERVAGLVFLEGYSPLGVRTDDPLGIFAMLARNRAVRWGADPEGPLSSDREPRFLRSDEAVGVPSLLFVDENRTEESEWEQIIGFAGLAGRNPVLFPDSIARMYFERLAVDEEMQERGRFFWRDTVEPAQRATEAAFHRAFGDVLRTVPVDGRAIGYGYRDAPDLIYPHIRQFLRDLEPHIRGFLDAVGARRR